MNLSVQAVDWLQYRPQLEQIRRQVFIEEQGVPEDLEWDEFDATAQHFLVTLGDDEAIATARVVQPQTGVARIGRFAVLPAWRGRNIGQMLLDEILNRLSEAGIQQVELSAQLRAQDFYQRAGFVPYGEIYLDAGIEHRSMRLQL